MITSSDERALVQAISRPNTLGLLADSTAPTEEVDFRLAQIRQINTMAKFTDGNTYIGKITARADQDHALVNVNGVVIKLPVQKEMVTGQQIILKYQHNHAQSGFTVLAKNLLQDNLETNTHEPIRAGIPNDYNASQTHISPSAQWLNRHLTDTNTLHGVTNPIAIAQHPIDTKILANSLKQTVSLSGMFYESHLAELTQGQRTLDNLLQEPQNKSGPHIHQLIQQQLQILETNRFEWQGQIWPQQLMKWTIQRFPSEHVEADSHHQANPHKNESDSVESTLKLTLPKLGKIQAQLQWQDGKLRINIGTNQDETRGYFEQTKNSLIQSLSAQGQTVTQLTINSELDDE